MHRKTGLAAVLLGCLTITHTKAETAPNHDAQTLLSERCGVCHGDKTQLSGLSLAGVPQALRGGQSGPAVVPGHPEHSLLIQRVREGSMPPGKKSRLSEAEIGILESWVRTIQPVAGPSAPVSSIRPEDREFWSFRPLKNPAVPTVKQTALVSTPVDAFLLEQLEKKQLIYAKTAGRATWMRRAFLDLTGLPPSPAQIAAFEADRSANAFSKVVDQLLASPHFGERWGRHWLDLAGYVDTVGRDVQSDGYKVGEGRWKYRDYVIRAFNQDKPYKEFLTEQLAGDELFDWKNAPAYSAKQVEMLTATGFLRTVEDPTDNAERDFPLQRYEVLHQTIDIVSSSVMGLTVACARCHNHKFDPITQKDYYGLMAVLSPAYNPVKWTPVLERQLADVPPAVKASIDEGNARVEKELKIIEAERDKLLEKPLLAILAEALGKLPENSRERTKKAALLSAAKRNAAQKKLVKALGVDISEPALAAKLDAAEKARYDEVAAKITALTGQIRKYGVIEALYDTGDAPEIFIHRRGDFESKGPVVPPSGIEVLGSLPDSAARRRTFAEWLTREGTPAASLVARVYVNRVWMHLFGQGLVATPENFGKMGARPSNPELLDWLSSEFIRTGWSTKTLIRTMMLSRAYQQSSMPSDTPVGLAAAQKADPENNLLWHMPIRRLESEVIRDSMLAVAGSLNLAAGGPPVKTVAQPDGMVLVDDQASADPTDRYRRSIYLVARRRYNLSMLGVFDHPVMSTNATTRGSSAVVLQSLMMMNDKEVSEQSDRFAARVAKEAGAKATDRERIALAYRYAYGRTPSAEELEWTAGLLGREQQRLATAGKTGDDLPVRSLASVCHVLLNTNEFLYVE